MCITKPRHRVKPLVVPSSGTGISLPSAFLSKGGSHGEHHAASKTDESKIRSLLPDASVDISNHISPPCVPGVVGPSSSESSLSTFDNRPTSITASDFWANPTAVTNATPDVLASSPGSKIVDDSWPTLDAVFDEIEVQKSQLEAERSLFGLAASEAEDRRAQKEKPRIGQKVHVKKSPKKLKHDYRDTPAYQDRSCERIFDMEKPSSKRVSFPLKLHRVLSEIEADGLSDIVGWQPHGRAFLVHDTGRFRSEILPRYFDSAKPATFLRQLNLYGFQRLRKGADRDGYYHEYFLKGREDLIVRMARTRIKGTGVRQASNPDLEPNLYLLSPVGDGTLVQMKEETPKLPKDVIDMERKPPAAIIQPSPELSASSPYAQEVDETSNIDELPVSSAMYDAYLETSPPVALPHVSARAFLEQNAASFVQKSAHKAVEKAAVKVPPPLLSSYQRQVSDDDPMEDAKPAAVDSIKEFDAFFSELDKDLAFLCEDGQSNHLDDDLAFGHLLDQLVADI